MNDIFLEGNEKLTFNFDGVNILNKFGSDINKKIKYMGRKNWEYTKKYIKSPSFEECVKYELIKEDNLTPLFLKITDENKTLLLKYTQYVDDSETNYGDIVLTFTTKSLPEEKYKEILFDDKDLGIRIIKDIINKTYDLFVKDSITEILIKEIEKLL